MASKILKTILTLEDKASPGLKGFLGSISKIAIGAGAVTAGLKAVKIAIDKMVESTKMAIEQEKIFNDLSNAVNLTGENFNNVSGELNYLFNELQSVTRYGDTETARVFQQLTILTNDYDKSMQALPLTLDLAASGLFDLNTAARMMGMVMSGNVEMLGRYVPELKTTNNEQLKNASATEKTAIAVDILTEKFGGLAEAEDNISKLSAQVSNYWGDIKENVGDAVLEWVDAKGILGAIVAILKPENSPSKEFFDKKYIQGYKEEINKSVNSFQELLDVQKLIKEQARIDVRTTGVIGDQTRLEIKAIRELIAEESRLDNLATKLNTVTTEIQLMTQEMETWDDIVDEFNETFELPETLDGFKETVIDLTSWMTELQKETTNWLGDTFKPLFQDSIDLLLEGEMSFKNFGDIAVAQIKRIVSEYLSLLAIQGFLNLILPGSGTAFASGQGFLGKLVSGTLFGAGGGTGSSLQPAGNASQFSGLQRSIDNLGNRPIQNVVVIDPNAVIKTASTTLIADQARLGNLYNQANTL